MRVSKRIKYSLHESFNVQLLGLLAFIFLSLSPASSLLSMQTCLADLHYLLYDLRRFAGNNCAHYSCIVKAIRTFQR